MFFYTLSNTNSLASARRKAKEQTKSTSSSRNSPIAQGFTVSASPPCSKTSTEPLLNIIILPALIEEPSANSFVWYTPDDIVNDATKWCEHSETEDEIKVFKNVLAMVT